MDDLKSIRETFLPDPGCIFIKADLSQVEDRVGKMYCGSKRMVELANLPPWEYDAHTENAKAIFRKDEISKQDRYLGKKCVHASVDKRTEFLTKRGFVFADQLTQWDEVAQWDIKSGYITFTHPIERYAYDYTGKMLRFRSKFFSQYLTADHRMVYQTNGKLKWSYAKDLPKGAQIPLNGFYSGRTIVDDVLIRLIVATQADGTYCLDKGRTITWHLKKVRKIERLVNLLNYFEYPFYYKEGKNDDVYVRIRGTLVEDIVYWLPQKKYGCKLFELSGRCLDVLLSELKYWDGDDAYGGRFRSCDVENINWLQAIAHLRGKRATLYEQKASESSFTDAPCYTLNFSDIKYNQAQRPHIEYKKNYTVYCLAVPTGYMVIRRNGCVSITGNSWRQMAGTKMSESVSKDTNGELYIPPSRCQKLIDTYLAHNPEIEEIYFPWCREQVQTTGICRNSWGRIFDVRDLRIDADLYRKVYSFYPQSDCADWTNQYGLVPGNLYMFSRYGKPLNMQIHDEVVASVPPEDAYDCAFFLKVAMEQTREIPAGSGLYLKVPVEITISTTLYGGFEFEQLPERGEFNERVREVIEDE